MEKKQTAVQEIMSIVEMDYNNGVEISMKVFYGMLQNALIKEREQMIDFHIADIIRSLSPEIEKMHYQSRDRNQCYLQSLLTEAKNKGNLAMELIYALEKHLNK